jgi:L-lactate dehydrogenase
MMSGLAAEIVLINRSRESAEGEAMDLTHAVPFATPADVRAGEYADCAGASIVVLTVGAPQGGAGSRLDLVEKNGEIFREIVPAVVEHNPDSLLLIASNPVDSLTYAAWKLSGFPPGRVIGSGTILDTARLRALLGRHLDVDPRDIDAFVVGEHGDSQVALWSTASVAGQPVERFAAAVGARYDDAARETIAKETREAGPAVAERKGATYYGVASGLLRIAEAVLRDERSLLAVSTVQGGDGPVAGVALSLPSVVGRNGVERVFLPELDDGERAALEASAAVLRETNAKLGLD